MGHKFWWNGPEWLRQPENAWSSLDILSPAGEDTEKEVKVQSENVTMISSKEDNAILLLINRHSSIHKVTRIFTYVQRFISSIKRRIQSSKVKQRTTKISESLKACSSTPKERTDSNESTSQPMIRTYNSVSLQGKDLYEGRLQLYSFIQRNFLHDYKIIRNQPTEDASNSSRDATHQGIQQRNKFTGPEGFGGIGRAGGPGSLVSTGGAGENASSVSTANSLGRGRAGGPGSHVSAGGADENASSVSTANSLGTDRAGGPGSLVSTGGAGENASSVSTNSLGIGRAGGPGCLVSVDDVGVSKDHVSHGIGWAGGPGVQLYIVSTGNTDNSSETVHQFNKDETREKNVLLTPMEQPLRGDTEDENFLEAAVSTAFHHFLMKKIK